MHPGKTTAIHPDPLQKNAASGAVSIVLPAFQLIG